MPLLGITILPIFILFYLGVMLKFTKVITACRDTNKTNRKEEKENEQETHFRTIGCSCNGFRFAVGMRRPSSRSGSGGSRSGTRC
jgi:hypothetical protein